MKIRTTGKMMSKWGNTPKRGSSKFWQVKLLTKATDNSPIVKDFEFELGEKSDRQDAIEALNRVSTPEGHFYSGEIIDVKEVKK